MNIGDSLTRATGIEQLTLLGPDGPMELQITAAMSSKDSFATDYDDRLRSWIFEYTYRRTDCLFDQRRPSGAQSAPEVPVIETLPEPMTAQSGGLYI